MGITKDKRHPEAHKNQVAGEAYPLMGALIRGPLCKATLNTLIKFRVKDHWSKDESFWARHLSPSIRHGRYMKAKSN
ncbi:hypothetical protein ACHAXA_004334 [Cyclostephanos tholiformis]|uniref:Uncharacterized protein n=1 Tax=Cyclostephanos tholiformis TaxID=382380 RepID=A0ABD3SPP8_9STRA